MHFEKTDNTNIDQHLNNAAKAVFNMEVAKAAASDIDSLIETVKVNPMVVFDRDEEGNTPLHNAVLKPGFEKLIVEIVNAGAEIEARNNKNQTPADIAVSPAVSAGLTRHAAKQKAFMQYEMGHCKKNNITPSVDKNLTGDAPSIKKDDIVHKMMGNSR